MFAIAQPEARSFRDLYLGLPASAFRSYALFAEEAKISVNAISVCHAGALARHGILIPLSAGR